LKAPDLTPRPNALFFAESHMLRPLIVLTATAEEEQGVSEARPDPNRREAWEI